VEKAEVKGKAKVRVVSWGRGKETQQVVDHQLKHNMKIKQKNLQCQINVIAMNVTHILPVTRPS
jgi:hypothetical protein